MAVKRITINLSLSAEELDAVETALEDEAEYMDRGTFHDEANRSALDKVKTAAKKLKNINGSN